jgi:hypothetical protein
MMALVITSHPNTPLISIIIYPTAKKEPQEWASGMDWGGCWNRRSERTRVTNINMWDGQRQWKGRPMKKARANPRTQEMRKCVGQMRNERVTMAHTICWLIGLIILNLSFFPNQEVSSTTNASC